MWLLSKSTNEQVSLPCCDFVSMILYMVQIDT